MARPRFRTTYWQNYPEPFYPGASGRYPVPGWGVMPVMAGPARLGVGNFTTAARFTTAAQQASKTIAPDTPQQEAAAPPSERKLPWWLIPLGGAIVLGAVGYIGTRRRWF